jgi:hypothetical protein
VARLIHLNGPPGSGSRRWPGATSPITGRPQLRHRCAPDPDRWLGGRLRRRRCPHPPAALAMIGAYLAAGNDVVLPQMLCDPLEVARFSGCASGVEAELVERFVMDSATSSVARFGRRGAGEPTDPWHGQVRTIVAANGGEAALRGCHAALEQLLRERPDAVVIDSEEGSVARDVRAALRHPGVTADPRPRRPGRRAGRRRTAGRRGRRWNAADGNGREPTPEQPARSSAQRVLGWRRQRGARREPRPYSRGAAEPTCDPADGALRVWGRRSQCGGGWPVGLIGREPVCGRGRTGLRGGWSTRRPRGRSSCIATGPGLEAVVSSAQGGEVVGAGGSAAVGVFVVVGTTWSRSQRRALRPHHANTHVRSLAMTWSRIRSVGA